MLEALATVILVALMLVPVVNIFVGLIAGAVLGGPLGAILGAAIGFFFSWVAHLMMQH